MQSKHCILGNVVKNQMNKNSMTSANGINP